MVVKDLGGFDLPEDILKIVVANLPAKSILRFMCVSKSWYHIIKYDPSFFALHKKIASSSTSRKNCMLVEFYNKNIRSRFNLYYCSHDLTDRTLVFQNQRFNALFRDNYLVGSCDGLICFATSHKYRAYNFTVDMIVIWNPCIRKFRRIVVHRLNNNDSNVYGFGFCNREQDYKVVMCYHTADRLNNQKKYFVDVYSLKADAWRLVEVNSQYAISDCRESLFVNGALHWVGYSGDNHNKELIISFSFEDEKYRMMELPHIRDTYVDCIGSTMGLLSIITFSATSLDVAKELCDVWVLRDYQNEKSWTKLFSIKFNEYNPLGFGVNGEVLVCKNDGSGRLVMLKEGGVIGEVDVNRVTSAATFIESLALLNS